MIELQHISKSFGIKEVLDDISLALDSGTSLAILGRSGTGKSVLTRIILGLITPDAGQILIDGQPMSRRVRRAFLEQTGVLFQASALFDSLTVWENVAFRLRNGRARVSRAEARERAEVALGRVGLEPRVADLFPSDLSGGMQKRVGLARAIIGTPKYLFFDEPNSGLDTSSLETKAERTNTGYTINGRKIWTTGAQRADKILIIARTTPKDQASKPYLGLSLFYTDFDRGKIDATACSKKVTESLIKAGAFDSLDHPRKGLMLIHADAIDAVMGTKKAEAIGQFDLFGGEDADESISAVFNVRVPDEEWDTKHKLALEREMLGLYVSGHPLDGIATSLRSMTDTSIAAVHAGKVRHGQKIKIGGIVAAVDRRVNKKGESWAIVEIADLDAATEILVFSTTYAGSQHALTEDSVLLVTANVSIREGRTSVVAVDISVPELGNADPSLSPMTLTLAVHSCTRPNIEALRETLQRHPGNTDVHIALTGTTTTRWATDPKFRVHKTPALYGDLKALFGANCLTTSPPSAANA